MYTASECPSATESLRRNPITSLLHPCREELPEEPVENPCADDVLEGAEHIHCLGCGGAGEDSGVADTDFGCSEAGVMRNRASGAL